MSKRIDKFGRKRPLSKDEDDDEGGGHGFKLKVGHFDIEGRQFINVGDPKRDFRWVNLSNLKIPSISNTWRRPLMIKKRFMENS